MIFTQETRAGFSWLVRVGLLLVGLLGAALPGKTQAREAFRADAGYALERVTRRNKP